MAKTRMSKLLTATLALAICFAMVFGSVFTSNAESSGYFTWGTGAVSEDLTNATINLTLTYPNGELTDGISVATFKLNIPSAFTVESVVANNSNISVTTSEISSTAVGVGLDSTGGFREIVLTFTFSGDIKPGNQYKLSIQELILGGPYGEEIYVTDTDAGVLIETGCNHAYGLHTATRTQINTVEGYYVYKNAKCIYCGKVSPNNQIVPVRELENILYWDGTMTQPTQTDSEGNILITSAAELAYVCGSTVSGNYKIADGIEAIVLQPQATVNAAGGVETLMALDNYAQTKAYFEATTGLKNWVASSRTFSGTFDGNGVEIYGLYANGNGRNGLFGKVAIDYANSAVVSSTIKNVAVKNSYCVGDTVDGAFCGSVVAQVGYTQAYLDYAKLDPDTNSTGRLTFDKCVISGCYLSTTEQEANVGVLIGSILGYINVSVKNTLVYGSHAVWNGTDKVEKGLFSDYMYNLHNGGNSYNNTEILNSIIFDCLPYSTTNQTYAFKPGSFSACYTNYEVTKAPNSSVTNLNDYYLDKNGNNTRIIVVEKNSAKGDNAKTTLNLLSGWNSIWFANANGGYPTHNRAILGFETDTWDVNADLAIYSKGGSSSLALSYNTYNLIDPELEGSGTEADPYIISSAEELVAVTRGHVASKGKYFKVKDGIKAFYMNKYLTANNQNTTAWIDENADFDTVVKTFTGEWVRANGSTFNGNGNYVSASAKFEGHFDGNGVVIYGLRSENPNGIGAGLFPLVQGNVTIKNVSVKKSYVAAVSAGVIVGNSTGEVVGNKTNASLEGAGSLTIENCAVVDAYIKNTAAWGASGGHGIGAIFGKADHMAYPGGSPYYNGQVLVKNCFVNIDDNYVVLADGTNYVCRGGIGGFCTSGNTKYENCVVLGTTPYARLTPTDKNHNRYTAHEATYTNVYTDATVENATVGGTQGTKTFTGMTKINPSDVKGADATSTLPSVYWNDTNNWSCGEDGEYPTPVLEKIAFKSSAKLNLLATNISYNQNGTFNLNFYYSPASADVTPVLYVGRDNGKGLTKLQGQTISSAVAAKLGFGTDTLCYTISNISAREINTTLLPTAVAKSGKTTIWGQSQAISIADYANAIINEDPNISWNDSTTAQKDANKKVAAALVNYGTAANVALNTPNVTTTATETDTWEPNADLAIYSKDGSSPLAVGYNTYNLIDPELEGSGTEADPYIISSAEELVAVTRGHVASAGKYFKVKDGIKAFYMNQYLTANKQNTTAWIDENADYDTVVKTFTGQWVRANGSTFNGNGNYVSASAKFEGHFDGNGVTIYGLKSENPNGTGAGLFPLVQGNVTIKNVNVKKSYVAAVSAGVIVGYSTGETVGDNNNASLEGVGSLTIENCTVTDAYIKNTKVSGSSGGYGIGAIFGKAENMGYINESGTNGDVNGDGQVKTLYFNGPVTVKNCFVDVNNDYVVLADGTNYVCRGGIGGYSYTSVVKYQNCIVLGITPYATLTPTNKDHNKWTSYGTVYTNVYTDTAVSNVTIGGTQGTFDFSDKITKINPENIKGMSVMNELPDLGWKNGYWAPDVSGYPTPTQANASSINYKPTLTGDYLTEYKALTLDSYNDYGESTNALGLYITSLTHKTNPYLSLVFAFSKDEATGIDYKVNRQNIKATITTASGSTTTPNVPAYTEGEYISGVNGWTNKKNSGRFHMYDLKSLPVYDLADEITVQILYNNNAKVTSTISLSGFYNESLTSYYKTGDVYYANFAEATKALIYYAQALKELKNS